MLSYDTDTIVVHTIIVPVNKFDEYSALEVFHLDKDKRVEALELKWVLKCVKSVRKNRTSGHFSCGTWRRPLLNQFKMSFQS